jgi:hypothetical protein
MSATTFSEYVQRLTSILDTVVAAGEAVVTSLEVDQRSAVRGFIVGSLQFEDSSTLDFREFVDVSQEEPKMAYAYHYRNADHNLIFRYDNAMHRPALSQPAHKHTPSGVEVSAVPTLSEVLDLILRQAT